MSTYCSDAGFNFDGSIFSRDGVNCYKIKGCKKIYTLYKLDDELNDIDKRFRTRRKTKQFLLNNLENIFHDVDEMKQEYEYRYFMKQKNEELKEIYYKNQLIEIEKDDEQYSSLLRDIIHNDVHRAVLTT